MHLFATIWSRLATLQFNPLAHPRVNPKKGIVHKIVTLEDDSDNDDTIFDKISVYVTESGFVYQQNPAMVHASLSALVHQRVMA